jgi:FkbM family methyltransferase
MAYIDLLDRARYRPKRAIFEVGGHDGTDTLRLTSYGVPVFSFEPNPEAIKLWKKNAGRAVNAQLVEAAVGEVNGTTAFFAVDPNGPDGNIGASSLTPIDLSHRRKRDREHPIQQVEITVQSIRWDTFCDAEGLSPDVLCLDCQESELRVLRGLGGHLRHVNAVVTEATFTPTYMGGCSYDELASYLADFGLRYVLSDKFGLRPPRQTPLDRIRRRYRFFDAVFLRA